MDTTLTRQTVQGAGLILRQSFAFVVAALMLLSAGCQRSGPVSDPEAEHEVNYQRARKLSEDHDFAGAAEFYKKALAVNPDFANAHLELGLLSEDKLADPIAAIYHYRQFLELRPASEKRQVVEDFIERAKLSLAATLPQTPVADPGELTRLQNEKAALLQENATLRTRVAELQKSVATAESAAQPPGAASPAPSPAPAPAAAVAAPPGIMAAAATEPAAESPRVRLYVVQRGDTLQSLALRYYGTRAAWDRIYQANRSGLPSRDQLKVGQQLMIP